MIKITGKYYDGKSSKSIEVQIEYAYSKIVGLKIPGVDKVKTFDLSEIKITAKLGNALRRIEFPDGSKMESADQESCDDLLAAKNESGKTGIFDIVSLMEKKNHLIFSLLISTILVMWLLIQYGMPYAAYTTAEMLPESTGKTVSELGLSLLDKAIFYESELEEEEKDRFRNLFYKTISNFDNVNDYRLEFRNGGKIGANALALPSGIIIFTDELIKIIENDHEFVSILAHEIGHVKNKHSLRKLLLNSYTTLLISITIGDVISASTLAAAIPDILLTSKYSREFEREADNFSLEYLSRIGVSTTFFANILDRLIASHNIDSNVAFGMISSHPMPEERIDYIRNYK